MTFESCVFFFHKKTQNQKNPKKTNQSPKIHKIVPIDFFISNELTNQQKLTKIKDYFYVCETSSELLITEINENDQQIDHKRNYISKDNTMLLVFEDKQLVNLKHYLKTLNSPKKYIFTIIEFYKHLLKSMDLLVTNHIYHNQIHLGSIMVDKHEYPLISNFSFSIDLSRTDIDTYIKHFIIAYEPDYVEWPIELHILSYQLTNKLYSLSSYNIESIICDFIQKNTILNTFGEKLVQSFKEEAIQYFGKYVNQSYEYILMDMLQYSNTWDNYALSILFLRILIGIHKAIRVKNKFIVFFMKLLVSNIHLNPGKRLSIHETMNQFEQLLVQLEINDYKEVIKGLSLTASTSSA
jgi:hypothetical protein